MNLEKLSSEKEINPEEKENFQGQKILVFGGTDAHGVSMAVETARFLRAKGARVEIICNFPGTQPSQIWDQTLDHLHKEGKFSDVDRIVFVDIPLNLQEGEKSRQRSQDKLLELSLWIDENRQKRKLSQQEINVFFVDHHQTSRFQDREIILADINPKITSQLTMEGIRVKSVEAASLCRLGEEKSKLALIGAIADKDPLVSQLVSSELEKMASGLHLAVRKNLSNLELSEVIKKLETGNLGFLKELGEKFEGFLKESPLFLGLGETVIVESAQLPDSLVLQGLDRILQRTGQTFALGIVRSLEKDLKIERVGGRPRPPADILTWIANWRKIPEKSVRILFEEIIKHPFFQIGSPFTHYGHENVRHIRLNAIPLEINFSASQEEIKAKITSALAGKLGDFERKITETEYHRYLTEIEAKKERIKKEERTPFTYYLYDDLKFVSLLFQIAEKCKAGLGVDFSQGSVVIETEKKVKPLEEEDDRQVFSAISFLGYLEQLIPLAEELKTDPGHISEAARLIWNKTERNFPPYIYSPEEAVKSILDRGEIPQNLQEAIIVMLRDESRTSHLRTLLLSKEKDPTIELIAKISPWKISNRQEWIKKIQDYLQGKEELRFAWGQDPQEPNSLISSYLEKRVAAQEIFSFGQKVLNEEEKGIVRDYLSKIDLRRKPAVIAQIERLLASLGKEMAEETPLVIRTKTANSLLGKLEKKIKQGKTYLIGSMTDLIGGRIIAPDLATAIKISQAIQNHYQNQVLEHLNFYRFPRPGDIYRAEHFILDLGDWLPMELQLKTKLGALQTELYHDAVYKKEIYGPVLTEQHRQAVAELCEKVLLYELLDYAHSPERERNLLTEEAIEQRLKTKIAEIFPQGKDKLWEALAFSRKHHLGQKRKEGREYIIHPQRVALKALEEFPSPRPEIVIACLFHDLPEDVKINYEIIKERFGAEVVSLCQALAKKQPNQLLSPEEEKNYYDQLLKADEAIRWIKVQDRLDNLYSLWLIEDKEKIAEYLQETEELVLPLAKSLHPHLASKMESAILLIKLEKL